MASAALNMLHYFVYGEVYCENSISQKFDLERRKCLCTAHFDILFSNTVPAINQGKFTEFLLHCRIKIIVNQMFIPAMILSDWSHTENGFYIQQMSFRKKSCGYSTILLGITNTDQPPIINSFLWSLSDSFDGLSGFNTFWSRIATVSALLL
jgi:hypothetical protein